MFEDPTKTKKYLKIAIFGKGGTGKTRFALSFPGACVIDSERGTDPYREKYQFKVIHASRWKQLGAPIKYLKEHPGEFKTLIIDSCTVFYGDLINDIVEAIKAKRLFSTPQSPRVMVSFPRFALIASTMSLIRSP